MINVRYYDEFIQTNEKLKKDKSKKFVDKVYFLGYIDGLYDESEYKRFIPDDDSCIDLYAKGYTEGKTDKENKTSKVAFTKMSWLLKLVLYDYKNGFRDRNLSENAKAFYDLHYDDLNKYGVNDKEVLGDMIQKGNIRL